MMQLIPVQPRKVIRMIKFDTKALRFKPVLEYVKLFGCFLLLILFIELYTNIQRSLFLFVVPVSSILVGFLFLRQLAEIFTYGDVNHPLSSNEYATLDAVLKKHSEVKDYISSKVDKGVKLTKRDFYYLTVPELYKCIIREKHKADINQFALEHPDQTTMANDFLDNFSISSPITFTDDAKTARKKKIKNALLSVTFLAILGFIIYALQFYDVDTRFKIFPVVMFCVLLAFIFSANIFFSHKQLIEENLLDEFDYEKIRQLSKVDIKIVDYLKQIKDQDRLLYTIDYQAMSVDKRYDALQDFKYATLWEKN